MVKYCFQIKRGWLLPNTVKQRESNGIPPNVFVCVNNQTAFGGMLQQLVELTSIVLRPEALNAEIERRCKHAWEQAPCPDCGETSINAGDSSPRLWCSNCRHTFTYTRNTPFEGRKLTPGEIIIAFVLYADTLLSSSRRFTILFTQLSVRWKPPSRAASTSSGHIFTKMARVQPRSTKPARSALGSRDRRRRGKDRPAAARVSPVDLGGKAHQAIQ